MEKAQAVAASKGGQLVSPSFQTSRKLKWKCRDGHLFELTWGKVYRRGKWCPQCGASKGEREIRLILQNLNIQFEQQWSPSFLSSRRYDFKFMYNGQPFLIEYDGEQHFHYVRKYHRSKKGFEDHQAADKIKTWVPTEQGFRVIRIDYTQIEHARHHILTALQVQPMVYLSTPDMYKFLL